MIKNWQHVTALAAITAIAGLSLQVAVAQSEDEFIEEVVTVGTRNLVKPRSAADSTVPIDVISGDEFGALGGTADITDNLRAVVPSYTATPATGDGSAFVRPTSLRGTASDQTLVLVNGRRRHRSALVHFFAPAAGNGSHSVDIGMIPAIAIERVEVLRDGASSQYGSDAIAGVINFIMKDDAEGGDLQVQYGQYFDGEDSVKVAANAGLRLGDIGFANVSLEYVDNQQLIRSNQRADAQTLIDAGVSGVGADCPFSGCDSHAQTWGRPETSGVRFFLNSGFDISDTAEIYARVGAGETEGRYRFFYRHPTGNAVFNSSGMDGSGLREQGFTGLPAGFTPYLDGDQTDISLVGGVVGEFQSGVLYDFSVGFGKNELNYFLNNTVNQTLGPGDGTTLPQMDFDVGGYEQKELSLNADFSLPLSDTLHLAFGGEWREETYTAVAGEPNSYLGFGASGLKGVTQDDAVANERDNVAVYVDLEQDVSEAFLVQYALRFEDFSDFGSTLNGKVAARYRFSDTFAVRGAVSTGFHAPTPGQANVRTTITTADSITGNLVIEGLLPPTDPAAVAVGGKALTEETSVNLSLGFTTDIGENTTLTVDVYKIDVEDRIYRTGNIPDPATGGTISFYTNALELEHTGLDLVLTSSWDWSGETSTDLSFAYAHNEVDVMGQTTVQSPTGPILPVSANNIQYIETNFPEDRFVLTANTFFGDKLNLMVRANYYGDHHDERGSMAGNADGTTGFCCVGKTAPIDSTIYFDLDLGYQLNDNWRINLGAVNIFDEFVNEVSNAPPAGSPAGTGSEFDNRVGVGLPYPRRSAANYEGGSFYLRANYSF